MCMIFYKNLKSEKLNFQNFSKKRDTHQYIFGHFSNPGLLFPLSCIYVYDCAKINVIRWQNTFHLKFEANKIVYIVSYYPMNCLPFYAKHCFNFSISMLVRIVEYWSIKHTCEQSFIGKNWSILDLRSLLTAAKVTIKNVEEEEPQVPLRVFLSHEWAIG